MAREPTGWKAADASTRSVAVWRTLERLLPPSGTEVLPYLPLMRTISAHIGKTEPFLRSALCLEVFAERGLLNLQHDGDRITLCRCDDGKKVRLEDSPYILRVQRIGNGKGGGTV